MLRADHDDVALPRGQEPRATQDERAHDDLAQLRVGLQQRAKPFVRNTKHAEPALGARANERPSIGEHGYLTGEFPLAVKGNGVLELFARMDDRELALENDVEREMPIALLEDDLPIL